MKMPRVLVTASIVGCLLVSPASLSGQPPARFQLKLTPSDGASGDKLACAVAVDGRTLIAGSFVNDRGTDSGAVYLYQLEDGAWLPQEKVSGQDTEAGDLFGYSVSTASNRALVGAPLHDDGGEDTGAAYVFVVGNGRLRPEDELTASDAAPGDAFGSAVATDGARAAIGAPGRDVGDLDAGAVYVFELGPDGWSQQAILEPGDPGPGDRFGRSLALGGELVAAGAPYDDDRGTDSGSVYVFRRRGAEWLQEAKLVPDDTSPFDAFGYAVATDGQRIFVGAPRYGRAGAAYVYRSTRNGWTLETRLDPPRGAEGDQFGVSVATDSESVLVGSRLANDAARHAGAVSLFRFTEDRWTEVNRLVAGDAAPGDELGLGIALSDLTVVAGAYLDDTGSWKDTGAIYLQAPEADLSLELTSAPSEAGGRPCRQAHGIVGPGELVPGCGVRYTLRVLNAGPDEVTGMKVRFPVTQGARAARGSGSVTLTEVAWSCSMEGGRCGKDSGRGNLNESIDLPPGTPLTYTVTARIPPGARGTLARSATLEIPTGVLDRTPAEPTATDTALLTPVADVSVKLNRSFDPADPTPGCVKATALVGPGEVIPGCAVLYTLEVSNRGPSQVSRVPVRLEEGSGLLSDFTWMCTATRGKCTKRGDGNVEDRVVLPRRGRLTYSLRGTLPPTALGTLDVSASVTLPEGVLDLTEDDRSTKESATLRPVVGLDVKLDADPPTSGSCSLAGQTAQVPGCPTGREMTVANQGPSATSANVCLALQVDPDPANPAPPVCQEADAVRDRSARADQGLEDSEWTCTAVNGADCSDGQGHVDDEVTLPVGGEATYRLTATVDSMARGELRTTSSVKPADGVLALEPDSSPRIDLFPLEPVIDGKVVTSCPSGCAYTAPPVFGHFNFEIFNPGPSGIDSSLDDLRVIFHLPPAFSFGEGYSPAMTGEWTCMPEGGAECTDQGEGEIVDASVSLPAGGRVKYIYDNAAVPYLNWFNPDILGIAVRPCVSAQVRIDPGKEDLASPLESPTGIVSGALELAGIDPQGRTAIYNVTLKNEMERTQFNNPGNELKVVLPPELLLQKAECGDSACGCLADQKPLCSLLAIRNEVSWSGPICPGSTIRFTIEAAILAETGTKISVQGQIYFDTQGDGINEATAMTAPAPGEEEGPTTFTVED